MSDDTNTDENRAAERERAYKATASPCSRVGLRHQFYISLLAFMPGGFYDRKGDRVGDSTAATLPW